jgi:hypothetical protein
MSSGVFNENVPYETDSGLVLRCKVQPETGLAVLDATTTPPTLNVPNDTNLDDETLYPSVKVSLGKREIGWHVRKINCEWGDTEGTNLPAGYKPFSTFSLVIFDPAKFAAIQSGQKIDYLGNEATVKSKQAEYVV